MTKRKEQPPHGPARRFHAQFDRLQAAITAAVAFSVANPQTRVGEAFYRADGRTPLFYLEGLARLRFKTGPDRRQGAQWLLRFKALEDSVGQLDYWRDLQQRGSAWKLPAPILAYWQARAEQALGVVDHILARQGWATVADDAWSANGPEMAALRAETRASRAYSPKKEAKILAGTLAKYTGEIQSSLENGRLDLGQLEHGIHEFRRKLRWLPIYGLALGGKIVLDVPDRNGPFGEFVTDEMIQSRFNQLAPDPVDHYTVRYHAGCFYATSALIAQIGKLKDRGLWTEEVSRSATIVGLDPGRTALLLGADAIGHAELVGKIGNLVQSVVVQPRLLAHMSAHLRGQA